MKIPKSISRQWLHRKVWPNDPQSGQRLAARTTRPEGHPAKVQWSEEELERAQSAVDESVKDLIRFASSIDKLI